MNDPIDQAKVLLQKVLETSSIDKGHGLTHAFAVLHNSQQALRHVQLKEDIQMAIQLASLLHDADDRKFFPKGSSNSKTILETVLPNRPELVKLTIKMINLVSCSKNGISRSASDEEWLYYPRWADRLEALGKEGIRRAYQYTIHRNRPLDNKNTPRTNSPILLYGMVATPRRLERYLKVKESDTFIDHFYDKILHLRKGFNTTNPFFLEEVKKRHQIVENFVLEYCTTPDVQSLINKYLF